MKNNYLSELNCLDKIICQECGLPLILNYYNNNNQDTINNSIELICQNFEHKTIRKINFEEYNNLMKNNNDKTFKCSKCKIFIKKDKKPFYCYECTKIFCSECINSKNHVNHKNIFTFDQLTKKCLIHAENNNDIYYFCLICKKNMCDKCIKEDFTHFNNNKIKKIDLNLMIKNNISQIQKEQEDLNKKIKILENKMRFNEFIMEGNNKYFYLFNDYNNFNKNFLKLSIDNNLYTNIIESNNEANNDINNINKNYLNILYHNENLEKNKQFNSILDECQKFGEEINGNIILTNNSTNLKLVLKYISKNNSKSKFFLIVNGESSRDTVKYIKDNKNYRELFINACIFTTKDDYLKVKEEHSDFIKNIYKSTKDIIKFIKLLEGEDIINEKYFINTIVYYKLYKNKYFNLHKEISSKYGDESEDTFNSNLSIIKVFIQKEDFPNEIKTNLINCFSTYKELTNKKYDEIIICYLKNNYFSTILNRLLMTKEITLYKKIGYFVGNLMHCLVQYGKKEEKGVKKPKTFYSGLLLNIIDLLEFLKNRNNKIFFPYFLSMTTNLQLAENSSKRNIPVEERKEKDLYSVIMTIHYRYYNKEYEPCIYEVKDLSEIKNEEENILLPFTFLIFENMEIDSEKYIADITLNILGKKEILEYKIQQNKKIIYDSKNKIIVAN